MELFAMIFMISSQKSESAFADDEKVSSLALLEVSRPEKKSQLNPRIKINYNMNLINNSLLSKSHFSCIGIMQYPTYQIQQLKLVNKVPKEQ